MALRQIVITALFFKDIMLQKQC